MNMDKKHVWHRIKQVVSGIKDGLGRPIDRWIKETVVALKASGVHTTFSCQGHLDYGTNGPYIDVAAKDYFKLSIELDKLCPESRKHTILCERIEILNLKERAKLLILVDRFYKVRRILGIIDKSCKTRFVGTDERLIVRPLGRERSRLESQGVSTIKLTHSKRIRAAKLKKYRKEMRAFTAFLKLEYFLPQKKRP